MSTKTAGGIAAAPAAPRSRTCHNHGAGVQIVGKCAGSVKYNKVSHNGRRNVLLSRNVVVARLDADRVEHVSRGGAGNHV